MEKLREDSSAITGKARKKTQENKGAVWENNQNSKENPRQSTEKVIDKTQKKTVEKTNGTSVEETQSAKEKNRACKKMQSRHLRGARKRRQNRLKIQNQLNREQFERAQLEKLNQLKSESDSKVMISRKTLLQRRYSNS